MTLGHPRRTAGYAASATVTAILLSLSLRGSVEFDWTEVVGFSTGALCVWLTVEERVSQWPIGNASDVFYVVVFARAGLYADTGLQVGYIALGFAGWYWWLRGGHNRSRLVVQRTRPSDVVVCVLATAACTALLTWLLGQFTDSTVPFWDGLTTALSLVATAMLVRKLVSTWLVWMTVDVIYIGLYIYKGLYLTSILYATFLSMCVVGITQWRRTLRAQEAAVALPARLAAEAAVA
jgi:nicotinamide mononucleotide transporter